MSDIGHIIAALSLTATASYFIYSIGLSIMERRRNQELQPPVPWDSIGQRRQMQRRLK